MKHKNKKLAIIGANEAITVLIKKAKELGYETHVFAWQCGDPGEEEADFFYPISISDKKSILNKCREIGVCGVCSITSDFAAPVVAYLSRELGLPGNPTITDLIARNKYEMRKAFKESGNLYSPNFAKVDETISTDFFDGFSYPLIVKPTDRWSSKGITRVDRKEDLKAAISYAVSESLEKKAIVEEYMDGPEYSAECIVQNGHSTVLAFTKKMTTGAPHYIESGHEQPSDIPLSKQDYIKDVIQRALAALHIENSAAHAEFRILTNGQIGFMEIGARMGGDTIGTYLTPYSTGMDYVKMVIDVACGNKLDFSIKSEPIRIRTVFIMNQFDLMEFEQLYKQKPNNIIYHSIFDDDCSVPVTNSSDRHGYYVMKVD